MIPVFFKAIRPAAAIAKPKQKPAAPADDLDSDIVPHDDAIAGDSTDDAAPGAPNIKGDAPKDEPELPGAEPAEGDPADDDAAGDDQAADDTTGGAKGKKPADKAPDMENYSELLAILANRMEQVGDFGPHNVKPGHHIAFSAGDFAGSGKVAAAGRDGARVHDSSGREHQVHWGEVTGHFAGDDEAGQEPATAPKGKAKGKAKGNDK